MFVIFSVAWIINRCLGLQTKRTKKTHEMKKKTRGKNDSKTGNNLFLLYSE